MGLQEAEETLKALRKESKAEKAAKVSGPQHFLRLHPSPSLPLCFLYAPDYPEYLQTDLPIACSLANTFSHTHACILVAPWPAQPPSPCSAPLPLLQDAARHASNRQRREEGVDTRRPVMEEEDLHEADKVLTISENAPQACRTRTRQPDNMKRWGQDGFEARYGGR